MTNPYELLAPFYDRIAPHDGDDLPLYAALARVVGGRIIELGCGTGRLLVPLAQLGFAVTGVEQSPAMLALARARIAAAGVEVELVQGSMLDVALPRAGGLAVCAQDTFLHLQDATQQRQALRAAGRCLAPGGRIVLDLPALGGEWSSWEPGIRPLELAWSGPGEDGADVQHFTTYEMDPSRQIRTVTHLIDIIAADGMVRRQTVRYPLRFVAPAELPLLAAAAGLRLDDVYGDYDQSPFGPDSRRMIAVLKEEPDADRAGRHGGRSRAR